MKEKEEIITSSASNGSIPKSIKSPQLCPLCGEEDNLWKELPCGHKMCTHCMVDSKKDQKNTSLKICPMSECETKFAKITPKHREERRYWRPYKGSKSFITTSDYCPGEYNPPPESSQILSLDMGTESRLREKRKQYADDDNIIIKRKGKVYAAEGQLLTHEELRHVENDNNNRDLMDKEQKSLERDVDHLRQEVSKLTDNVRKKGLYIIICIVIIMAFIICIWDKEPCKNPEIEKLSFEIIPKFH